MEAPKKDYVQKQADDVKTNSINAAKDALAAKMPGSSLSSSGLLTCAGRRLGADSNGWRFDLFQGLICAHDLFDHAVENAAVANAMFGGRLPGAPFLRPAERRFQT
jgi:hypothetical protein